MLLDRGYIREFAQAAETGGFDQVLVGYFSDGPDGFLLAAAAAAHTERLSFLVAHRPGFVAPTLAARKFATLDQITGGRAAIHVISRRRRCRPIARRRHAAEGRTLCAHR